MSLSDILFEKTAAESVINF